MRFVDPKNDVAFKKIFGDENHKEIPERFRWTKEELEVYDYWSMKLQDERGALTVAERRGEERGRHAEKVATARAMLADGMDATTVAKYTGLNVTEVLQLPTEAENVSPTND